MRDVAARIVDACRRHAFIVAIAYLLLAIGAGYYAATHLSIDTDLNKLISPNLPWRQQEQALNHAFPQNNNLLAIVIDGHTPDETTGAANALAQKLKEQPQLFHAVRIPGGGSFFAKQGLLFMPVAALKQFMEQLISAQPLLATLANDPSLTGVFGTLDLLAQGALHGQVSNAEIDRAFGPIATAVDASLQGKYAPLSWQNFLSGRPPDPRELRQIVLVQPVLDYSALEPGARATAAIRANAAALRLTPDHGVQVRITGDVAFSDDQLATLSQGATFSSLLSLGLLCLWLLLGLQSVRLVGAIMGTLIVGLLVTSGFAGLAVGALNPISVAFAVLFIGIAVDFGIQFSVRFRDERHQTDELPNALRRTGRGISGPLSVAAAATSVGFLAFVPTDFAGVSDLGKIAGVGMLIALALNLTLLPALLAIVRPRGEARPVGFAWMAPVDRFLFGHRKAVMIAALLVALASATALPRLSFDFNPLDLQNQNSEAMQTLHSLMSDPNSTPYTIEVLKPSVAEATETAKRIDALPEVAQTVTVNSFISEEQDEKLAIINDARTLLGPSIDPAGTPAAPNNDATLAAITKFAADVKALAARGDQSAARLSQALDGVLARGKAVLPILTQNIAGNAAQQLERLRESLSPEKVTLANLPAEIKDDWVARNGAARIEVDPKGNMADNTQLVRFVNAVRAIAPAATGTPVTILESGKTITRAFATAGVIALAAISILLLLVLRRIGDVLRVIVPLLFAGLLTLATGVMTGLPLNYANIITLPLLLGIGVSFDIYFVMRWRGGTSDLLQSSTARAILFSALTTGTAFGSLALSSYPGTADMGKLLVIALAYTLICTLLFLPALLGPAEEPRKE